MRIVHIRAGVTVQGVTEPPVELEGAVVIATAETAHLVPSGGTKHSRGHRQLDPRSFAHLVIAQYEQDPVTWYLFYCDETWGVLIDTAHDSRQRAEAQGEFEFPGVAFKDR